MENLFAHPTLWLEKEFVRRKSINPNYSLRRFAKTLEISPGKLSEILASKRSISAKRALLLAEKLSFSPEEKKNFIQACFQNQWRYKLNSAVQPISQPKKTTLLSEDVFSLISDWHHYAILSLIETDSFNSNPKFIAKALGISVLEARSSLKLLERLGLIKNSAKGIKRLKTNLSSTWDVPSTALKKTHRQSLEKAIQALDEYTVNERSISSCTIAMDASKIPQVTKEIQAFFNRFCKRFEKGKKNAVYEIGIHFIPLTKTPLE